MIPSDITFDPNATPPQWTDNEDSVIQVGTHVRVKIFGTREEVGSIYAIASIKEDYLGLVCSNAIFFGYADKRLVVCKGIDYRANGWMLMGLQKRAAPYNKTKSKSSKLPIHSTHLI
jgi:DUF2075 family protein